MATASPERVEHALQVLSSLENMKSQEFICDFKVKVNNRSFNTHRSLLAACSGYFEALFSSNMKEVRNGYVVMEDVDVSSIEQCIGYMYTGSCEIQMDSVEGLLHASNLLQIHSLEKKCCKFLMDNLRPDNCLTILNLARTFDHQEVLKAAEDIAIDNMKAVILSDLFLRISGTDLIRYISNADCNIVWQALITWSKGKEKGFENLAEGINFSNFSFELVLNEVLKDPLVEQSEKIKLLIQTSLFSDVKRLEKNLNPKNCFQLKKYAADAKSKEIINIFMCDNFTTILSDPQFCDLSEDEVLALVKSPKVGSEKSKWEALLKWVKHDINGRKALFPDFFCSLKLPNLPLKFLKETVRNEELVNTSMACMNLLMDAIINYSEQTTEVGTTSVGNACCSGTQRYYLQQPPGGQVSKVKASMKHFFGGNTLSFEFQSGSYQGIQYQACSFKYQFPNNNIVKRIKNAFNQRQMFKLMFDAGSDHGIIVMGDIELHHAFKWDPFSADNQNYAQNLSEMLAEKGL